MAHADKIRARSILPKPDEIGESLKTGSKALSKASGRDQLTNMYSGIKYSCI